METGGVSQIALTTEELGTAKYPLPLINFFLIFSDAVQAVLAYTMDAVELLNRKKMKREYLFRYLASNRVRIAPSAEKGKLVKKILEVWGSTELQNYTPEQVGLGSGVTSYFCHLAAQSQSREKMEGLVKKFTY